MELEPRFIVINKKHLQNLPVGIKDRFAKLWSEIVQFIPKHQYIVINKDEDYFEDIKQIMLKGEKLKNNESK